MAAHAINLYQDRAYQEVTWKTHNPSGLDMTVSDLFDIHHDDDGIELKNGQRDFAATIVPAEYAKRLFAYLQATGKKVSIRVYVGKKGTRISVETHPIPFYTTQKGASWLDSACDVMEL